MGNLAVGLGRRCPGFLFVNDPAACPISAEGLASRAAAQPWDQCAADKRRLSPWTMSFSRSLPPSIFTFQHFAFSSHFPMTLAICTHGDGHLRSAVAVARGREAVAVRTGHKAHLVDGRDAVGSVVRFVTGVSTESWGPGCSPAAGWSYRP